MCLTVSMYMVTGEGGSTEAMLPRGGRGVSEFRTVQLRLTNTIQVPISQPQNQVSHVLFPERSGAVVAGHDMDGTADA
jgi:hypothetical protein